MYSTNQTYKTIPRLKTVNIHPLHGTNTHTKSTNVIRISLAKFFKQSWSVLEPSTPLIWNWHLEVICDHVQALFEDWLKSRENPGMIPRIQNLLISVPPGSSKSRIASVCLVPWIWLTEPSFRGVFFSGSPTVAQRDGMFAKDLIQSIWYQKKFKPKWRVRKDKKGSGNFANTMQGSRLALGLDSSITGIRGDCLVADDLNDVDKVLSETSRDHVNNRWDGALENRVSNLVHSFRIGIAQRSHEDDWSGHVKRSGIWDHLIIRQKYDPSLDNKPTKLGWTDPRQKLDELMDPVRFPKKIVESEERKGSYYFSSQHQQSPVPIGGGIFKRKNWAIYGIRPPFTRLLLSIDASFKKGEDNDFCSMLLVGEIWPVLCPPDPNIKDMERALNDAKFKQLMGVRRYIVEEWHDKAGIVDLNSATRSMLFRNPEISKVIIEEKANGTALCDLIEMDVATTIIERFNPGVDSKISRAIAMQPYHESGKLFLPGSFEVQQFLIENHLESFTVEEWWAINKPETRSSDQYIPILESMKTDREVGSDGTYGIIDEFATFPRGQFDDRVDAMSQLIIWSSKNVPIVDSYFDLFLG